MCLIGLLTTVEQTCSAVKDFITAIINTGNVIWSVLLFLLWILDTEASGLLAIDVDSNHVTNHVTYHVHLSVTRVGGRRVG